MRNILGLHGKTVRAAAVLISLTLCVGCAFPLKQTETKSDTQGATGEAVTSTGNAYISLADDALIVHHFNVTETQRISATRPQEMTWSSDNTFVAFNEQRDTGNIVVVRDLTTSMSETIYASQQPVTQLQFSPDARQLAFMEEGNLFVMTIHGEDIQRLAEHVVEYAWSPNSRTVALSTESQTILATPSLQSDNIVYNTLREDQPMRGIAFRRADTLLGFVIDSGLAFVAVNTNTAETEMVTLWSTATSDAELPVRIQTTVSPDFSTAMISETHAAGEITLTQYTIATHARSEAAAKTTMHGWFGPHQPILMEAFHLVTKESILGDAQELGTGTITPPIFVRSYTSL